MTILSPALICCVNLVFVPVTELELELIETVPDICCTAFLRTAHNTDPLYSQNIPFWSSKQPARTTAPCQEATDTFDVISIDTPELAPSKLVAKNVKV